MSSAQRGKPVGAERRLAATLAMGAGAAWLIAAGLGVGEAFQRELQWPLELLHLPLAVQFALGVILLTSGALALGGGSLVRRVSLGASLAAVATMFTPPPGPWSLTTRFIALGLSLAVIGTVIAQRRKGGAST